MSTTEKHAFKKRPALITLSAGFGKFLFDSLLILLLYLLKMQVSCLVVWNSEPLEDVEIKDINQLKYGMIYGHPEALVVKIAEDIGFARNEKVISQFYK